MKYIILVLVLVSCGPGVDLLNHRGVCEGYDDQATSAYNLPWGVATSYEVTQGNCSGVSHFADHRFAYDFNMDIGDDIQAVRAGDVIEVVEKYSDGNGCPDDNHIFVEHSDGTIAAYVHLTENGSAVAKGDIVAQGDVIGFSGDTGCSSGPHLHFHVWKNSSKKATVPIVFKNTSSNPRGLAMGKEFTAQ